MLSSTTIRTVGIYIPVLTGSLSVLGSSAIIYSIWARRETKLKDPQHRILGMMSIFVRLFLYSFFVYHVMLDVQKLTLLISVPFSLGCMLQRKQSSRLSNISLRSWGTYPWQCCHMFIARLFYPVWVCSWNIQSSTKFILLSYH